jgi:hypothetical protein
MTKEKPALTDDGGLFMPRSLEREIDDASLIQKIRDYWAYRGYRVKVWVETAGGVSGCIRSNMINGTPQKRDRILGGFGEESERL